MVCQTSVRKDSDWKRSFSQGKIGPTPFTLCKATLQERARTDRQCTRVQRFSLAYPPRFEV